jgi:predicted PurR-regulated permease PerM
VPRVVSFLVLLAVILLVGAVFFRVMAQFMVPLFLACVLLVMFQPLHRWILRKLPKYRRIAALLTTFSIVLVVLVPTALLGWNAFLECQKLVQQPEGTEQVAWSDRVEQFGATLSEKLYEWTGYQVDVKDQLANSAEQIGGWLGSWLLSGVQTVLGVLIGLAIMVIALYYFFSDGPALIRGLMQLSPLDKQYELELLLKFGEISRAVVLAIVLSAVVQGLAASIGFYFALPAEAPIFLLTALTMVLAIVPFIGAAGVWVPVCLYIALHGVGGDGQSADGGSWPLAIGLGVYCAVIVSGLDNVIKPLVLHGQSNLHPLLALLSILGGVTVLGPVGILVGPMLVSFLQALMNMFHKELEHWGRESDSPAAKLAIATAAAAESIESAVPSPRSNQPANNAATPPASKGSGKKKRR